MDSDVVKSLVNTGCVFNGGMFRVSFEFSSEIPADSMPHLVKETWIESGRQILLAKNEFQHSIGIFGVQRKLIALSIGWRAAYLCPHNPLFCEDILVGSLATARRLPEPNVALTGILGDAVTPIENDEQVEAGFDLMFTKVFGTQRPPKCRIKVQPVIRDALIDEIDVFQAMAIGWNLGLWFPVIEVLYTPDEKVALVIASRKDLEVGRVLSKS